MYSCDNVAVSGSYLSAQYVVGCAVGARIISDIMAYNYTQGYHCKNWWLLF